MKKSKKIAICGFIAAGIGLLFVLIAIVVPIIIDSGIRSEIPGQVAVSKENQDQWDALPGKYNIEVIKRVYLYNCTNPEDVVLKGAKPEFVEYDPVPYLDIQKFQDVNYTRVQVPSDDKQNERNAAIFKYAETYELYNGTQNYPVPEDYNNKIVGVNPAAFGLWYGLKNAEEWRTQLGALYSVTIDGLGNSLIKQIAFNLMVDENFGSPEAVKASLWPTSDDVSVDTNKTKLMRTDKYYGLNNADNVAKWYALCSSDNDTRIEFQNEIFTYFGISHNDMLQEATNNFCSIVSNTVTLLESSCPKQGDSPCDASDFAYWQWAESYFTMLPALELNKQSVSQLDDTILGFPEMSYFRSHFISSIQDTKYAKEFDTTNFGSSKAGKSYPHLFYLPSKDYQGDLPGESLFNLDTLQDVYGMIPNIPDVSVDKNATIDYTMLSKYTELLKLDTDKQTYMLFMWLKNMLEVTAMRKSEGGSYYTTNIMGLGQDSLSGAINWMSREFPAYLYGNIMALSNSNECETNIKNYMREVEDDQVQYFCNDTLLNLVSTESYNFYASLYFTRDDEKIQYIFDKTGISDQAMAGLFTHDYYLERNLITAMKKVKKVFNDTICSNSVGLYCSNRELAYAQWWNKTVSSSPPKPLNATENLVELTGVHHYKPEIKYFYDKHGATMPNVTLNQIWDMLSNEKLFNQLFIGDVLLGVNSTAVPKEVAAFNTPTFKKYLKMLMIEEGLGGIFIEKTVKDYIEGYNDKNLLSASMMQLEEGGDPTINPWMSINDNPTNPINGTDCFFVGDDKHKLTREYGLWLNNRYVRMTGPKIRGVRDYSNELYNPWGADVPVRGTDGGQFNPLMTEGQDIYLFISDIMMPIRFTHKSDKKMNGLNAYKYEVDPKVLEDMVENKDNEKYYQHMHGTLNLTSVMQAPILATKGHNLDIGKSANYTSLIYDKQGKEIKAKRNDDDVFMVVEPWSGLSLAAAQRLTLNFLLEKDDLFENVNQQYLLPYTYVKREFKLNEKQTDDTLGALKFALGFKLGIQITGYLLGGLLLIGAFLLFFWAYKIRNVEGLSDYQIVEDYKPNGSLTSKKEAMLNGSTSHANEETKDNNSTL